MGDLASPIADPRNRDTRGRRGRCRQTLLGAVDRIAGNAVASDEEEGMVSSPQPRHGASRAATLPAWTTT
ncbi:hypothetical protein ACFPRL_26925 [Pseudoclavibacter helvolus]